ncbi:MAG: response regulator [Anaerolineales bacterium]|nr:response regulator [Anaerolineales bacterium]
MQSASPKILIIDDDKIASAALEGLLSNEPYELYFAYDGMDGISMAVSIHPDVILLDVMMPKMDGFEVCRRIRAIQDTAEVPIILITSLDDHDSLIQGLHSGADDFVTKPYNSVELFARLQTILRLNRYRRIIEQQRDLKNLHDELLIAYDKTIEGWSRALDLRDKETEGHSKRVTEMAVELARAFGLSESELVQVRWGALLHDIGKMGVPDGILLKPGPLTEEEWVKMRIHPTFAYEMLAPIHYLRLALDIPYCHHEKWDGTGYPQGLKGDQIPLTARIFAVVDVWDALSSDRPYRLAWTEDKVREHIRASSGTHFDPQVVGVFMQTPDCI